MKSWIRDKEKFLKEIREMPFRELEYKLIMAGMKSPNKEFKWKYCPLCDTMMVICPKCGNNTCNGGHGTVDGEECDVCPKAYEVVKVQEAPPKPRNWKQLRQKQMLYIQEDFLGAITEKDKE